MTSKKTTKKTNPLDELGGEKTDIPFPDDEATAQEVSEFLGAKETEGDQSDGRQEAADGQGSQSGEGPGQGQEIPRDDGWAQTNAQAEVAQTALGEIDVEVTEEERNAYWKSVLTDTPFSIPIPIFDGSHSIVLRERTNYEQQRVMDILQYDIKEGDIEESNINLYLQRMQEYFASLMVTRIAGQPFSDLKVKPDSRNKTAGDRKKLREFVSKNIWPMTTTRWNMILSAMQQFESKCHRLKTELHNQNFWMPQDTEQ